jgi:hypothetical protein
MSAFDHFLQSYNYVSANMVYLLHYFHKMSLIIYILSKTVWQHGLRPAAILNQPRPTGSTVLSPVVTSDWKVPSYLTATNYCFIPFSKNIYVPLSF